MDNRTQIKNGPATLLYTISLVTLCSDDVYISFPYHEETLELRVSFLDDAQVGPDGQPSVKIGSESVESGTRGTITFVNMLRAGEITPLHPMILLESEENKEYLYFSCEVRDPHKGRPTSRFFSHKTITLSFWLTNSEIR